MPEQDAIAIESWLASHPPKERGLQLFTYLNTLDEQYRDAERTELLRLAKTAAPRRPLALVSVLQRRVHVTLKAPLYVFGAPNVPGCEVTLETHSTQTGTGEWKVVFWAGGGQRRTIQTSLRSTFVAGTGEIKQIFLPVPAIATRRYLLTVPRVSAIMPRAPIISKLPLIQPLTSDFQRIEPIVRTPAARGASWDPDVSAPGAQTLISAEFLTAIQSMATKNPPSVRLNPSVA